MLIISASAGMWVTEAKKQNRTVRCKGLQKWRKIATSSGGCLDQTSVQFPVHGQWWESCWSQLEENKCSPQSSSASSVQWWHSTEVMGAEQCQEPAPQTELTELYGVVWDPGDLGQHDSSGLHWLPPGTHCRDKTHQSGDNCAFSKKSIFSEEHNAPFRYHCGVVKEVFYL